MSELIVRHGGTSARLCFDPPAALSDVLAAGGIMMQKPCGGGGRCGKCRVLLSGAVSDPNPAEVRAGARLACQAVLLGNAEVVLPEDHAYTHIETDGAAFRGALFPLGSAYGAAVDIGTTTMALTLYDLRSGAPIAQSAMRNPQTSVAADVMGRIGAAMSGALANLRAQVSDAVKALLTQACSDAGIASDAVDALVLTGNTTMLYLLCGRDPESLSHAPFEADCLFDEWLRFAEKRAYLPPCMHAFVGADITCAVLASGMCEADETCVLMDVGTNGEIALRKDGVLYVTSTAAGPAFEGAGISCGCGSVRGAIDRVQLHGEKLCVGTIDDAAPVGVCGSGLIDAIAAFYALGEIDETGATEKDALLLSDSVFLLPADVRAVQLAKAAIAAGLETLMESARVRPEEVNTVYVAGGFGSHLSIDSAAAIGLIPAALKDKVRVIGNAALAGASMLLLDAEQLDRARRIAKSSRHVNLGGNPRFNQLYMDHIFFPEE